MVAVSLYGTAKQKHGIKYKNCRKYCVQVLQYTKNGTFVADYASVTDAAKSVGGKVSNICRNCRGEKPSAYGYVWKYKE